LWATEAKANGKRKLKLYVSDANAGKSRLTRIREKLMGSPDASVLCSQSLAITMVNTHAERLFGFSAGELLHKHINCIFADASFEPLVNSVSSGKLLRVEDVVLGSYFPLCLTMMDNCSENDKN
jgi:hypothetical protein